MNHPPRSRRPLRLPIAIFALLALLLPMLPLGPFDRLTPIAQAAASLTIEPMAAYNFVVDSNVLSPSTYAPEAGTLAAKVCNTGADPAFNVVTNIGDFSATPTPGIYPSRTHPGLVGNFSLTHEGGSAGLTDATRFLPRLDPGKCAMQYWVVSYPRTAISDGSVFGGVGTEVAVTLSVKPIDDLWLEYDMWATSSSAPTVNVTRTVTMRNEISAAANKIWPNTDSKVPAAYLAAINKLLGWDTITPSGGTVAYPGQTVTTQGIWYDLGNVGFGFDNNGDGVPDKNAWVQPIGDPGIYDPGCFRLVRTYGIVVVKLVGGGEQLIPFVDQLYFENLPNNTGAVGLVYYQYAALDGACTAALSPYQEVASGFDNEKFSGDYGFGIPPLQTRTPAVAFTKGVDKNSITTALTELEYTIRFTNTATETGIAAVTVGDPSLGIPLVFNDVIPAGTDYVAGSATATGITVSPSGVKVAALRYSTDNGATWTENEPAAGSVTNLQWWLDRGVPQNDLVTLKFKVTAPVAPPVISTIAVIPNTAEVSFGTAPPFAEATARTLVQGPYTLSGTAFRDVGTSSNIVTNGVLDTGEPKIQGTANTFVSLYRDMDGDGKIDPTKDILVGTTNTDVNGFYSFGLLTNGNYLVTVDTTPGQGVPTGHTNTTVTLRAPVINNASVVGQDFGFAPVLDLVKKIFPITTTSVTEDSLVTYTLDVTNRFPGNGTPVASSCVYTGWGAELPASFVGNDGNNGYFFSLVNATGVAGPDGLYAFKNFSNNADSAAARSFGIGTQNGTITKVEAIYSIYTTGNIFNDQVTVAAYNVDTLIPGSSAIITTGVLNSYGPGSAKQGLLIADLTGTFSWSSNWTVINNLQLRLSTTNTPPADTGASIFVDAIGVRVTTSESCASTSFNTLNPVPLSDTYDPARLAFVSSVPSVSSMTSGTLNWENVGPLYPGQTRTVTVTFRALEPTTNPQTTINNAAVAGARFADGRPANDDTSSANVSITPSGSITGRVWADVGTLGWVGTTGYEGSDAGLPGVSVSLFACQNAGVNVFFASPPATTCQANGGTWAPIATTTTDASGDYRFTNLANGFYYTEVSAGTLPTGMSYAQTADPNAPNSCQGNPTLCNGRSADSTSNLSTFAQVVNNISGSNIGFINNSGAISANNITNVNYGYTSSVAGLSGQVWIDWNRNQAIGPSENDRYNGATVTLYNSGGGFVASTTTDANGNYRFTNLPGGTTYRITITTPGGYVLTTANDLSATTTTGLVNGPYNFGLVPTGASSIGRIIYYDVDGDGVRDATDVERGIAGVTVELYEDQNGDGIIDPATDAFITSQVTSSGNGSLDSVGSYLFTGLAAGNYIVRVNGSTLPVNLQATADPDESGPCLVCDGRSPAPVAAASSNLTENFGYKPTALASIGDTVYFDRNGNGQQEVGQEIGFANITVRLLADLNGDGTIGPSEILSTQSTDANGKYLFSNLPPGNYRVEVDTSDSDLPKDAFGVALVPTTPTSFSMVVTGGSVTSVNGTACTACNLTADFGFTALAAIGDTVYYDANRNGTQDFGEPGVAGVTVKLINTSPYTDTNGVSQPAGHLDVSTTTDANGKYLFSGLPAISPTGGVTYTVTVDHTTGGLGGPPARPQTADPDRDGAACDVNINANLVPPKPDPYTPCDHKTTQRLFPGSNFMGADFGYQPTGVVGDTLWIDANGNNVRDPEEYGIPFVTVSITGPNCTPCTTETDPNGEYRFVGLADGTYTVQVVTTDPEFTPLVAQGLVPRFDPDGSLDHQTTVVMGGGVVTSVGGTPCPVTVPVTNCDLNADFGYRFFNASGFDVSGTICVDGTVSPGLCGTDASITNGVDTAGGEAPFAGQPVYLYRWKDDGDGNRESGEVVLAAVTTTAANGDYSFTQLPAATGNERYIVGVAAPGSNLNLITPTTAPGVYPAVLASNSGGVNLSALRIFNLDGPSSPLTNQDFAYVSTLNFDYGDAPASYGVSLSGAPAGPRHQIPTGGATVYLGTTKPDLEPNGLASLATNDNTTGTNDEDGVKLLAKWTSGATGGTVSVTVSGAPNSTVWLAGWVDFGKDGSFGGIDDQIINQAVTIPAAGFLTATYTFEVPASLFPGGAGPNVNLFSRFRVFTEQPLLSAMAFVGDAVNGEVEDHLFEFTPTAVTLLDFTAAWMDTGVRLAWATATERETVGFQLWRATSAQQAEATLITPEVIYAEGNSVSGWDYSFDDLSAEAGTEYFYWLEELGTDGVSEFFGPVKPTAAPAATGSYKVFLPFTGR